MTSVFFSCCRFIGVIGAMAQGRGIRPPRLCQRRRPGFAKGPAPVYPGPTPPLRAGKVEREAACDVSSPAAPGSSDRRSFSTWCVISGTRS